VRRIFYRADQFRRAWGEIPSDEGVARAKAVLTPALFDLFTQLLPYEQAHSISVFDQLVEQGFSQPDFIMAALLHDVGKSRFPLRPWQRVVGVLAQKFFPNRITQWGKSQPTGLLLGVVVAEQHAQWGAELAKAAGASESVVRLIANHQDPNFSQLSDEEGSFIIALQAVDKIS